MSEQQERPWVNPEVDLRNKYPKWFEWSMIAALLITMLIFYGFKRFENTRALEPDIDRTIESIEIPPTQQIQKPPPPARPKIPVESEDDDIPEDMDIDEEMFEFDQEVSDLPPPPEEEEPIVPFHALADKPVVIKRIPPKYPELAKKAGIEGLVIVKVLIDTKGNVEKTEILKSHPLLDESALEAAKNFKFKPGKQRDKFVKVWMSIPFNFKLKN